MDHLIPYYLIPLAFLLVMAITHLLSPVAQRIGLIDSPGGRKTHTGQIPLIGGIAMFLAFTVTLLVLPISLQDYRSFFVGGALLVFVGTLDDLHELSARSRLTAQIAAVLLMVLWGHNYLANLGNLLFMGVIHLGIFSIPLTLFAVVGVINAVNMLDGADGLAGSVIFVELVALALLAFWGGQQADATLLLTLLAAVLGFLVYNFRFPGRVQARIFMGDSGSMFLGFALSWFLISLSQGTHPVARPVIMLWIMIVPLFDTIRLLIVRALHGRSPFSPGRDHLHHVLEALGYSNLKINLIVSLLAGFGGLIGLIGEMVRIPAGLMFLSFIGFFIVYYKRLQMISREQGLLLPPC
jgi:UDP-GlcNAc:undecaprenyl-phosphate GlcNAc-1-phosphate transferase